ncbi:MAG: zinc-ribbon domain-containing protein [Polyangiaceae bacterium]|nr:zinc-ribbon domain-containing protein [Polyangiaceae bacterium]
MDVTCERCGTEYDFDDALVSERGTTVKCTNCGAQFRVYRPVPAAGPERWVVRTVDGRELIFSALRELQAAISTGVVGREDVLSRGGGRPRRLGSIAELEPFFKQAVHVAATSTAPGLGLPSPRLPPRQEGSVAIPLPRAPEEPPKRSGTLPPPPPVLDFSAAGDRSEVRARAQNGGGHVYTQPAPPPPQGSAMSTALGGSMQPTSVAAVGSAARLQNLVAADLAEPITMPRSEAAAAQSIAHERTPPVPIGPLPPLHPPPATGAVARAQHGDAGAHGPAAYAETLAQIHEPPARGNGSAARDVAAVIDTAARARKPDESGVVEKSASLQPATEPTKPSRDIEERKKPGSTLPPITPTPGEIRVSFVPEPEPSVSPRFSMASPSKRNSSVRWIVGVVLVGATALVAATMGRKYLATPAPVSSAPAVADERVAKFLEDGEKKLFDGDLDGAKEQFDKASALAENDPQVASHLAHLAVVRADFRWLKVRALPVEGAETTLAKAELADAVSKLKSTVDAAAKLLPNDPSVRRYRVDALRILGERSAARGLVGEMPASGKTVQDELSLAALDLAEEKPPWPTIIERLRSATAADGNLGRARSMLVYALAASGDVGSAKAEHDRLAALPRPHPLTAVLLAFMMRIDMERPATPASSPQGSAKPTTSAAPTTLPATSAQAAAGASTGGGSKLVNGRVPDDYVAPGAGTVDISDMGHHPAPTPTPTQSSAPAPTPAPQAPAPPGVDTSDLPGFKP